MLFIRWQFSLREDFLRPTFTIVLELKPISAFAASSLLGLNIRIIM